VACKKTKRISFAVTFFSLFLSLSLSLSVFALSRSPKNVALAGQLGERDARGCLRGWACGIRGRTKVKNTREDVMAKNQSDGAFETLVITVTCPFSSLSQTKHAPQAPLPEGPREESEQEARGPRRQTSALGRERGARRRRRFGVLVRATIGDALGALGLGAPRPLASRLRAALRRHREAPAPRRALQRLRRGPPARVLRRRKRERGRGRGGGSRGSGSSDGSDGHPVPCPRLEAEDRHQDPPRPGDPRGALPPRRRRRARGRARVAGARAAAGGRGEAREAPGGVRGGGGRRRGAGGGQGGRELPPPAPSWPRPLLLERRSPFPPLRRGQAPSLRARGRGRGRARQLRREREEQREREQRQHRADLADRGCRRVKLELLLVVALPLGAGAAPQPAPAGPGARLRLHQEQKEGREARLRGECKRRRRSELFFFCRRRRCQRRRRRRRRKRQGGGLARPRRRGPHGRARAPAARLPQLQLGLAG